MRHVWLRRMRRTLLANIGRGNHSPLAAKLLRRIFAFYFCIAVLITGVQMALEYKNEREKLQAEIDAAVELIEPVLSKSLWDFDNSATKAAVEGLARNRSLVGIRLEGDIPVSMGRASDASVAADANSASDGLSKLYEQHFAIHRPVSEGQGKNLATLRIYSSPMTVLNRSLGVFAAIVGSALVKTLALWLILYTAIRSLVARPLMQLAGGLTKIKNDQGTDFGGRRWKETKGVDELTFALMSFAGMRRALRKSRRTLLEYQQELEQKVDERTKELYHQATQDELTGLLNRRAFESEVTRMTTHRASVEVSNVLCLVDLDHFKLVNDSFGHPAGDKVLRQVADILRRHTRSSDIVARMGGDEFAIILYDCSVAEAQIKMQRLEHDVHGLVMEKDGRRVSIGLSAGLVLLSAGIGSEPSQAMANADSACYAAKQGGRHQARIFDVNAAPMRRTNDINWLSVIESALAEDRLLLYAQPILTSGDGKVRTIEVLVRMLSNGDVIAPNQFLPAAERYGLMPRIDTWVVSHTLDFLETHPDALDQFDTVHINLSAATICDPGYYRFVVRKLRKHPMSRTKLCFEINESAPIDRLEIAVRIMNGLRRRGVQFALDDFGHGMASFTYLQRLPVDCVKIDGSFVRDMMKNSVSRAIVTSINDIAHLAGMPTVAEFIGDAATSNRLIEMGVDYLQGYHIGRPVPIDQVAAAASLMRKTDAAVHMEETPQMRDATTV
jgi:diguanylate cyclase (GGDEF)-like protein